LSGPGVAHGPTEPVELGFSSDDDRGSGYAYVAVHPIILVRCKWWFHGCGRGVRDARS